MNIKNETDLGKQVKSYLDRGLLVPDELTIDLVWDRLDQDDVKKGFLLDGFPRTIAQAEALDKGLEERGFALDGVICINVDEEVLIPRLAGRRVCSQCGASYHVDHNPPKQESVCDACGGPVIQREDDTEETVRNRIGVYQEQTAPLIDYYRAQDLLIEVDGAQSVERVTQDIRKSVH